MIEESEVISEFNRLERLLSAYARAKAAENESFYRKAYLDAWIEYERDYQRKTER